MGRGWGTLWKASGREHGAHGLAGILALLPPWFVTSGSCLASMFFTHRVCQMRVMVLSCASRAVLAQELLEGKGLALRHPLGVLRACPLPSLCTCVWTGAVLAEVLSLLFRSPGLSSSLELGTEMCPAGSKRGGGSVWPADCLYIFH